MTSNAMAHSASTVSLGAAYIATMLPSLPLAEMAFVISIMAGFISIMTAVVKGTLAAQRWLKVLLARKQVKPAAQETHTVTTTTTTETSAVPDDPEI